MLQTILVESPELRSKVHCVNLHQALVFFDDDQLDRSSGRIIAEDEQANPMCVELFNPNNDYWVGQDLKHPRTTNLVTTSRLRELNSRAFIIVQHK